MTEIMQILAQNLASEIQSSTNQTFKQKMMTKMKKFCDIRNISNYCENGSFFIILESQFFHQSKLSQLGLIGFLEIVIQEFNSNMVLKLLDSDSNSIKASSLYQKAAICKFCNVLSGSSNQMCVMCNPLTGEVKFAINYLITQTIEVELILQNALLLFQSNVGKICQVLEFLQVVPLNSNKILSIASTKMEACRIEVTNPHQCYQFSRNQFMHNQYLNVQKPQFQIVYNQLDYTRNRIYIQQILENLKQRLVCATLVRKNWKNIELQKNSKTNKAKIQSLMNQVKKCQRIPRQQQQLFIQTLSLSPAKNIKLQFSFKITKRLEGQIERIQKLSRHNYFSFLRQFICIKNQQQINKKYVIKKHEQFIRLHSYLLKNKMSLSFETKLFLCIQLVGIAYVGMSQIKKFTPSYTTYDISITPDYQFKLQTIVSYLDNTVTSIQIAQVCFQILYNIKCSSHGLTQIQGQVRIKKWHNMVKIIDDGQSKYQGLSIINFWLKKILLDMINNQYNTNAVNTYHKAYTKQQSQSNSTSYMPTFTSFPSFSSTSSFMSVSNQKQAKNKDTNIFEYPIQPLFINNKSPQKITQKINTNQQQQLQLQLQIQSPKSSALQQDKLDTEKQLKYLQKLLFVLSLAYKTYNEIFQQKIKKSNNNNSNNNNQQNIEITELI